MAAESFPVVQQNGVGTLVVHDDTSRRLTEDIQLVLDRMIAVVQDLVDRSQANED